MSTFRSISTRSLFQDYADAPGRFDDRIEFLRRAMPEDAADLEVLADMPARAGTDLTALGTDDGIPPLWPILIGGGMVTSAGAGRLPDAAE